MTDELCYLSVAAASRLMTERQLSPVELTEAYLRRIEARNGALNAYVSVTAERALDEARQAEAEQVRGRRSSALHGIPFALKDIYDTAGLATTAHSALLEHRVPVRDSACAQRLGEAGAILLGKLATHEFATGGPAYDLPWPPAANPWLLDRFPGGSSSGSGAAVAAGLAPMAMGSDTAGSIRLPAGFCGVVGLKPTSGRVSKRGVLPLSWTLDTCGPLTWTVEDAALTLQAIAGPDPEDRSTVERDVPDFSALLGAGVKGLRIGLVRHFYEVDAVATEATRRAMASAATTFRELGATVEDVTLAPLADYQACVRIIILSEAYGIHRHDLLTTPELYAAVTRYRIMPGALVTAAQYGDALRQQRRLAASTLASLQSYDVLLTATTFGPAPVQATMRAEANFANPPLTNPFNAAPLPALSLCNGFSAEGLPLAMQIVGRPFDEVTVLQVANAFEKATGFRDARPTLREPDTHATPVVPGADIESLDPTALARCRQRVTALGLDLSDAAIADLAEAMPHVDAMIERLNAMRDYEAAPGVVFRW